MRCSLRVTSSFLVSSFLNCPCVLNPAEEAELCSRPDNCGRYPYSSLPSGPAHPLADVLHHRVELWRVAVLDIFDIEHVLGAPTHAVVTGPMIERKLRGQVAELGGRIGSL